MLQGSLALFDLDYTLYRGEKHHVILDFPHFLHKENLFPSKTLDQMTIEFNDYQLKKKDRKTFADNEIQLYYEGLKGQSVKDIESASKDWLLSSTNLWYDYAHELVKLMRNSNIPTVIISGSPFEPLVLVKEELGVDELYATRGEIDDKGIFTGNCEVEYANADAKSKLIQTLNFDPSKSFAFGDSESDFPLLEAVHPSNSYFFRDVVDSMSTYASTKGWQVHRRDKDILEAVKRRLVDVNKLPN